MTYPKAQYEYNTCLALLLGIVARARVELEALEQPRGLHDGQQHRHRRELEAREPRARAAQELGVPLDRLAQVRVHVELLATQDTSMNHRERERERGAAASRLISRSSVLAIYSYEYNAAIKGAPRQSNSNKQFNCMCWCRARQVSLCLQEEARTIDLIKHVVFLESRSKRAPGPARA